MEKERDDSSVRQYDEDMGENGVEKLSKHSGRDKDRRKSSRVEEKEREHRSKDSKERSKVKDKDYEREKSRDKDRKDRVGKEKEREKGRDRDRDRDRERERDRERVKEKEKEREKYKERDNDRDREREREKGRERNKEGEAERDKDRLGEKERIVKRRQEEDHLMDREDGDSIDRDVSKHGKVSFQDENEQSAKGTSGGAHVSTSELEERILKMKEERSKKKSDAGSEVLSFVNRMRKIEAKKKSEKEKAMQLSKVFEEQDNILNGERDDEEEGQHNAYDLAGVKVLHGLDKVMEGGAVVLTLKDQSILNNGDLNEEVDMLENVELGEQKRRNEAYKAAKKKAGTYDDKFNDDPSTEKRMLPQYDDPIADEGVTLDAQGRFTGEAEKKLEELRRRLQGAPTSTRFEDLNSSGKISSDYYTSEEMLQFKKPKKKKALRKKLDIDAIEAEAVAAGLGTGDLGSRNDGKRQAIRKERERSEAEMRHNAYQSALEKADEASKALRLEQTLPVKWEEDENQVFADDDEDLYKSLERARKLALKKNEGESMGPEAIALRATSTASNQVNDDQDPATGESQDKLVFTEMEEFVWALQHDEEVRKPDNEDVFMDEDEAPKASEEERKDEAGGWTKVDETTEDENPVDEDMADVVQDETIHEVAVGKGLSGALKLLKERGTLKETVEWGGRNMDKKKSKLVGIMDDDAKDNDAKNNDRFKDIRIERLDEFGRIMTPKEAFRNISHKFHGKGPGKMKLEKRMKQFHEELKLKQMKNSDTPSESAERMREAQAQLKTPYLVLSGHVKPGQTSDPRSGFATVEKEFPGSLTPMLGVRKVEQYLGIKRKPESGDSNTPKKPPKVPKP